MSIPKIIPIETETIASDKNCPIIIKGVIVSKAVPYNRVTTLNSTIETMSLATPSPKMQE